jgi:hypothetical protein
MEPKRNRTQTNVVPKQIVLSCLRSPEICVLLPGVRTTQADHSCTIPLLDVATNQRPLEGAAGLAQMYASDIAGAVFAYRRSTSAVDSVPDTSPVLSE